MDEKSDEILEHIETQRNQLGENLNELETRVRRTTDWRTHFNNNPMLMLAGALGGGILLGAMVSGSRSRSSSSSYTSSKHFSSAETSSSVNTNSATYMQKQRASETIDHIKAALIAFATSKAKEFLNQALPGFDNYYRDAESNRSSSQMSSAGEYNQGSSSYGSGSYNTGSYNTGGYNPGGYGQQTSGQGQGANYGQNYGDDYASRGAGQRNYSTEQTYRNS
jgi:hypothetical protein